MTSVIAPWSASVPGRRRLAEARPGVQGQPFTDPTDALKPARIEMIEVGAATPHPVTLWLAYSRALRPAEMRALALV